MRSRGIGASLRITLACVFAAAVLALVIAVLLSPLRICLIGLAVDLVNLALPMPDLLGRFGSRVDPVRGKEVQLAAAVPGRIRRGDSCAPRFPSSACSTSSKRCRSPP